MSARIVALLILLLATVTGTGSAQTASIQGRVLRAGTMDPVAGARVTYFRAGPESEVPARVSLTTDASGAFTINELEPGAYRLSFAAPGYVNHQYGQKILYGPPAPMELAAGQAVRDLIVRMIPGANIGGRVTDSDGVPAVGVAVEVVRFVYDFEGKKTLSIDAAAETDDRGEYRLFWLTPGRYYLRAGGTGRAAGRMWGAINGLSGLQKNQLFEPFAPIFYPNTPAIESADTIEIQAGAELKFDFRVPRQQLFRIRGRVVDSQTGLAPMSVDIGVSGENFGTYGPNAYNAATGTFEIRNVWPGSYKVLAVFKDPASPESSQPRAAGFETIRVSTADVDDVVLRLLPPESLSGHLVLQGGGSPPSGLRFVLQNAEGVVSRFFLPPWLSAPVIPDGSFRIPQIIEGTYNPAVSEPGYYVKQARYGGVDVLSNPLKFVSGGPASTLEVVISPNVAQISGMITNSLLQPAAGAQVVLVPDKRRDNTQFFHVTATDARGQYRLENIWPGDYKLFAWEAIEYGTWLDAAALSKYEKDARLVSLRESARATVDTTTIPAEQP